MTPEKIDAWLAANDRDRAWLATQLSMSLGSIYNGFSKGFSARTLNAIEQLMSPTNSDTAGLEVTFTAREFERIEDARNLLGIATRKLYYEESIIEYTTQILARETAAAKSPPQNITPFFTHTASKVAEDPAPYGSSPGTKKRPSKNGTED